MKFFFLKNKRKEEWLLLSLLLFKTISKSGVVNLIKGGSQLINNDWLSSGKTAWKWSNFNCQEKGIGLRRKGKKKHTS
jgi:hypothetical protein